MTKGINRLRFSLLGTALMLWSITGFGQGGTIGPLTWSLSGSSPNYTLTISGNGAMPDFTQISPNITPWYLTYRWDITAIVIGNGVTRIGNYAFWLCSSVTSVSISSSVTSIGNYAFGGCSNLSFITIPNGVTGLGTSAFQNCVILSSVTIPNSVTVLGDNAFMGCSGLSSVTIGSSVASIGAAAFQNCSGLRSITSLATTPPTVLNVNAFQNVSTSIPVYVPCGSLNSYSTNAIWSYFTNFISPIDTTFYTAATCYGVPYTDNNFTNLTQAGVYYNALRCDSVVCLTLAEHADVPITYDTATICEGDSYNDANFTNLTFAGTYYDTLPNINGCDSVIELTLGYYPIVAVTTYSAAICQGDSYNDANFANLMQADIYYDTLPNINGCDSVIELTLIVNPIETTQISASIIQGESYDFFGRQLTTSGTYYETLKTIHGCDSIIELTLAVWTTINDYGLKNTNYVIYPNPTTGKITIRNQESGMSGEIEIFDFVGRKLLSYTPLTSHSSPLIEIDISHLANGLYFLKIQTSEGIITKKIVKNQINK